MRKNTRRKIKVGGFTLIELMMTVAIVAILAMVVLPSYQNNIRKSRRTEAKSALLDLAGREERYFSTTNQYTNDLKVLGYSSSSTQTMNIGNGYYSVTVTADNTVNPPIFSIGATPVGGQVNDTTCSSFGIDQTGKQTDSTGTALTCWK